MKPTRRTLLSLAIVAAPVALMPLIDDYRVFLSLAVLAALAHAALPN